MAEPQVDIDELKRRLRRLKKLEMKIRPNNYSGLIWDDFFNLQDYDADINAVKKKFRELAKEYHPDVGGDSEKFIDLMENYRKLIDK